MTLPTMPTPLPPNWLDDILTRIATVRVAVFGDFCLDAYWLIDPDPAELSLETRLPVRRVRQQRYSLGGAGNVVANLAALGVAQVHAVGLLGDDLFGRHLRQLLLDLHVDVTAMLPGPSDWQTPVYAKPCLGPHELNRLDFGAFGVPTPGSLDQLTAQLGRLADTVDIIIVNQQLPAGLATPDMIARLNALVARHPHARFIADARHRAELFSAVMLKLNAHEAARLVGDPPPPDQPPSLPRTCAAARTLTQRTGQPVFITRGQAGIIAAHQTALHQIPGLRIPGPIDPVGAGDTTLAALAAALAAGGNIQTAATLANIAASITVQKLQTTGTATPAEIRAVGSNPAYLDLPQGPAQPPSASAPPHAP